MPHPKSMFEEWSFRTTGSYSFGKSQIEDVGPCRGAGQTSMKPRARPSFEEIVEESGFDTRVVRLLAVYDREKQGHLPPFPYHVYKLFFLCEITGGTARPNAETSEIAFFREEELPDLSVSRVKEEQLRRFFQTYKDPSQPHRV